MSGRALVTGAAGFVGQLLCEHLRESGWDVVRSSDGAHDGMLACDIRERAQVDALLEQAGHCTHVFHLAALAFVPLANRKPDTVMAVNLQGTIHLAQALSDHAWDTRLLYIGSADAYGPPRSLPMDESHPLDPQNPYAISKAAADQYCRFQSKTSKLEIVRLRPFNHSGAGQDAQFVLPSFARQIAEIEAGQAEPVLRVGNLEAARDFSHVRDIVRGYALAALKGRPGEAYNLCSGRAHTIQSALDALLAMTGAEIRVEPDPARMRPVDVPRVEGSYRKFESHTAWMPEISFETLLRDLLLSWRARVSAKP